MSAQPSNALSRALIESIRTAHSYRVTLSVALELLAQRDQELAAARRQNQTLRDELRRHSAARDGAA